MLLTDEQKALLVELCALDLIFSDFPPCRDWCPSCEQRTERLDYLPLLPAPQRLSICGACNHARCMGPMPLEKWFEKARELASSEGRTKNSVRESDFELGRK